MTHCLLQPVITNFLSTQIKTKNRNQTTILKYHDEDEGAHSQTKTYLISFLSLRGFSSPQNIILLILNFTPWYYSIYSADHVFMSPRVWHVSSLNHYLQSSIIKCCSLMIATQQQQSTSREFTSQDPLPDYLFLYKV